MALIILIAAGYDPAGMGQMFENMAKSTKISWR